jgi:hypothetical protein
MDSDGFTCPDEALQLYQGHHHRLSMPSSVFWCLWMSIPEGFFSGAVYPVASLLLIWVYFLLFFPFQP